MSSDNQGTEPVVAPEDPEDDGDDPVDEEVVAVISRRQTASANAASAAAAVQCAAGVGGRAGAGARAGSVESVFEAPPGVIYEGELSKIGGKGTMWPMSWRKRWFVLTSNTVSYHEHQKGAIKGGILLENATAVRKATDAEVATHGNRPNCWVIETPARHYVMSAKTHKYMEKWIKVASDALAALHQQNDAGSDRSAGIAEEEEVDAELAEQLVRRMTVAATAAVGPGGNGILKEGELTKQGGSGFRQNWRKRWFILTTDSLAYYDRKGGNVRGGILLERVTGVRAAFPEEAGNKKHCFIVETPLRNYLQSGVTGSVSTAWAKTINEAVTALAVKNTA